MLCGPCGKSLLELDQVRMSSRHGGVGWIYRCPRCRVVALVSQSTKWVPGMAAPLPVTHLVYAGVPEVGATLEMGGTVALDEATVRRRGIVPDLLAVCQIRTIIVQNDDRPIPDSPPIGAPARRALPS
ncbi:hypothetical protein GCM10010468_70420 [Actinocorallia longicatena]|uniref:Uncharacterized protein n=1 Tax=Actinocorallia longicatena TaxID=111803 RepID=A0ABP6QLZ1_9ACTN